mmetsp:Transcript_5655/g.11737  ORF Transcript_5655/g.11737 Transcript_5655/m.11737 type:complete len:203 (-) Transcript_5655:1688-2296(-)
MVNVAPRDGELSLPKGGLNGLILKHCFSFMSQLVWHIVVAVDRALFVSFEFQFLRMIAAHSIDESCEGRKENPNKDITLARHNLIDHSKVVAVDAFQQMLEVAHEIEFVVFSEWFKEFFIPFVRGNVNHLFLGEPFFHVEIQNVLGAHVPNLLELKIPPANMHGVEGYVVLVEAKSCVGLSRFGANSLHNSRRSTLDFITIT